MSDDLSTYQLRKFDPVLAAVLDSLPLGWEVAVHRSTVMREEQAAAEAQLDEATVQHVINMLAGIIGASPRNGELYTPVGAMQLYRMGNSLVLQVPNSSKVARITAHMDTLLPFQWTAIATQRAQALLHEPCEFQSAGVYPDYQLVSWCTNEGCDAMVRVPHEGAPIGTMFTDECRRAVDHE